jgi:putative ABC transport system substrate-binding protein
MTLTPIRPAGLTAFIERVPITLRAGMKRREFIAVLGGAAAWPFAARTQQAAMPLIGFLSSRSRDDSSRMLNGFHRGLADAGLGEGRNIAVDYRFAEGHYERLAPLAAELANRPIAVLVAAGGEPAARAAMAATTTTPVVVIFGSDPVANHLVDSLSHPGHNLTGVSVLSASIEPKRISLMHDLLPQAKVFGALLNPSTPTYAEQLRDIATAASAIGIEVKPFLVGNDAELETAFEAAARTEIHALLASADPFLVFRRSKIAELAVKAHMPLMYPYRDFPEAGGLMSYGIDLADAYRQLALYAGRIIRGDKPQDLPVVEPTKFEFVINLKAVKALGLSIPAGILAIADEVIE